MKVKSLKYVAYYSDNGDYEEFETYEEAEKWLQEIYRDDGDFSSDTMKGQDYIAKITHRSEFKELDNVENYSFKDEFGNNVNEDGDEWYNEYDIIGEITFKECN